MRRLVKEQILMHQFWLRSSTLLGRLTGKPATAAGGAWPVTRAAGATSERCERCLGERRQRANPKEAGP